jgi:hypothetical protein
LIIAVEQVVEADSALLDISLETRRNLACAFTGQVVNTLVIVIQTDFGQTLADGFGLAFHLHCGFGQAPGLLVADRQVAAHLFDGVKQAVELLAIGLAPQAISPT